MKRRRIRKWAKWVCTLAAVLAVSAAAFSGLYESFFATPGNAGDTICFVTVNSGRIAMVRVSGLVPEPARLLPSWYVDWSPSWYWGCSGEHGADGFYAAWNAGALYGRNTRHLVAGISMVYPVALTLIPAALLWYADRRRFGPGLCIKCGYDRHGLAPDAPCPECSTIPDPSR